MITGEQVLNEFRRNLTLLLTTGIRQDCADLGQSHHRSQIDGSCQLGAQWSQNQAPGSFW